MSLSKWSFALGFADFKLIHFYHLNITSVLDPYARLATLFLYYSVFYFVLILLAELTVEAWAGPCEFIGIQVNTQKI
jgi:hypothetical protein